MKRTTICVLIFGCCVAAQAADWIHWRGPDQNGRSRDTGLPESFGIREPGKEHLLWKSPIGGRSTPLVMNDKLYLITAGDGDGVHEHERVVCLNANTGALIWEKKFGVFHTDIVSSRLGWTSLTADSTAGTIFCHGTQGDVYCFDANSGEVKWVRNLTEEFGRFTGYGGRIVSPIYDSGLVIVGIISSSWGNHARGANRFVALDARTGAVNWIAESPLPIKGTYYSNPVIATINGQRLLIAGGGDGAVHAFNIRTGQLVWSHLFSAGVVNPSPLVENGRVYIAHGEENPEGGPIGRVICLDATQIDSKTKKPKIIWDIKNLSKRFGLASGALADGILYQPDDASEIVAFDAANGKVLWRQRYGTVSRGAPLVVDGKLYVFDVNGMLSILKLNGKRKPEVLDEITFKPQNGPGFQETHGTPICVNGRLYFCTRENTFCIEGGRPGAVPPGTSVGEKPAGPPVGVRIVPAEITAAAGQNLTFEARFFDATGHDVPPPADAKLEWNLPTPTLPPGAKASPPPLKGEIQGAGATAVLALDKMPAQQGYVQLKAGSFTSPLARVRVAPGIPHLNDFEKTPEGVAPGGWVNANGKFLVKSLDGNKVLARVNNDSRPPFARANGYITGPQAKDYVIVCDVMGTEVRGKLPDMGVVNSRYSLILDGKQDSDLGNQRTLRIIAWEALPRINKGVAFDWKPNEWYRLKFALAPGEKSTKLMGKVWKKGDDEPANWMIEFDDPNPYSHGAAALYGYVTNMLETEKDTPMGRVKETLSGSDIYYDNLSITPIKK